MIEKLINNDNFKLRSLDPPNNHHRLPLIIQLETLIENSFVNVTLYQIPKNNGQIKDSKVLFMDNPNSNIQINAADKLVRNILIELELVKFEILLRRIKPIEI